MAGEYVAKNKWFLPVRLAVGMDCRDFVRCRLGFAVVGLGFGLIRDD